jgi:hypothetical protein
LFGFLHEIAASAKPLGGRSENYGSHHDVSASIREPGRFQSNEGEFHFIIFVMNWTDPLKIFLHIANKSLCVLKTK